MAGGFGPTGGGGTEFEAKITPIVIISCIMAATGGLMFGYDVGVSGNYNYLLHLLLYRVFLSYTELFEYLIIFFFLRCCIVPFI